MEACNPWPRNRFSRRECRNIGGRWRLRLPQIHDHRGFVDAPVQSHRISIQTSWFIWCAYKNVSVVVAVRWDAVYWHSDNLLTKIEYRLAAPAPVNAKNTGNNADERQSPSASDLQTNHSRRRHYRQRYPA